MLGASASSLAARKVGGLTIAAAIPSVDGREGGSFFLSLLHGGGPLYANGSCS